MSALGPEAWAGWIPHAGAMRLLDAVLAWDAQTIHATSERHALEDHPLRGGNGLHAVHLAEYGAQAAAVHGALKAAARGEARMRAGRLVSLRDLSLEVEFVDLARGRLDVHAQCLYADERGVQYLFEVRQQGCLLASGRAAVMHVGNT